MGVKKTLQMDFAQIARNSNKKRAADLGINRPWIYVGTMIDVVAEAPTTCRA